MVAYPGSAVRFTTGAEAVAALPPTLRIGPFDWTVEAWDVVNSASRPDWGQCAIGRFTLCIASVVPSPLKACDTLLHEIAHAIWWAYKLCDEDKEERIVGVFGVAWTQVFRDNPSLLWWIARCGVEQPGSSVGS